MMENNFLNMSFAGLETWFKHSILNRKHKSYETEFEADVNNSGLE
jgi:hypothetical protein